MSFQIRTVLVIAMYFSVNGEFPDDFKLCKYGDLECIKETINFLFKNKSQGDTKINLPQLSPLKYDSVHLQQGEDSAVSLDLLLKNNSLYGLETAKVLKIKGFGKDLTKKHILSLHLDYLSTVGDYDVNGKILILPIKGSGNLNISFVDVELVMSFVGKAVEKDDGRYMHIEQLNLGAESKNMIYKVDNLFNGDKALGDNMNLFLNENWKEIYGEVRGSLSKGFALVFQNVLNSVFGAHPYDKLFAD